MNLTSKLASRLRRRTAKSVASPQRCRLLRLEASGRSNIHRFSLFWIALLATHAALALIPFAIYESKATAQLPYYSYFGILGILSKLGLNVFAEFNEGMFMAPVSRSGNVSVVLFWIAFHAFLAVAVMRVSRYFGFTPNRSPGQGDV